MYYYAHIDTNSIVDNVYALNEQSTDPSYIEITEAQYNNSDSLIGLRYDPDYHTFGDVIYWIGSTSDVNYKTTPRSLSGKLDEIDTNIAAKADESVSSTLVLTASAWAADGDIYKQTLEVANLGATQNGVLVISSAATDEQYNQACQADLRIRGQGAGYVLIKAYGDVPTVNIPLEIILL